MRRLWPLLSLLLSLPIAAEELTPKLVAQIKAEEAEALAQVNKKHGDKKPGEMNGAERAEVIQETAAAQNAVLDRHGVSAKEYARYVARMPLDARQEEAAEAKRLEAEKAKADGKAR